MFADDILTLCLVVFPAGWFLAIACNEATSVASNKWDKALWKLGAHFGAFLMGLAFVALVWRLPR